MSKVRQIISYMSHWLSRYSSQNYRSVLFYSVAWFVLPFVLFSLATVLQKHYDQKAAQCRFLLSTHQALLDLKPPTQINNMRIVHQKIAALVSGISGFSFKENDRCGFLLLEDALLSDLMMKMKQIESSAMCFPAKIKMNLSWPQVAVGKVELIPYGRLA